MEVFTMKNALLLSIMTLCICYSGVASSAFITTPVGLNAWLNGSKAELHCSTNLTALVWYVDGKRASGKENVGRGIRFVISTEDSDGIVHSTLQITPSVVNNNTMVQCVVGIAQHRLYSDSVVLRIQGLLEAPSNLRISYQNNSAIKVQWTSPFSLDIPNTPDILNYTLYIRDTATETVTSVNVSKTEYVFTAQELDHCVTYRISVSAWNQVGEGRRSEEGIAGHLDSVGPPAIADLNAEVVSFEANNTLVELKFKLLGLRCLTDQPQFFRVDTLGTYSLEKGPLSHTVIPNFDAATHQVSLTVRLHSDNFYTANVSLAPTAQTATSASVDLSTFDVQDAHVTAVLSEVGLEVQMICFFATGSTAKGCYVVLQALDNSDEVYNFNLTQNQSTASAGYSSLVRTCEEMQFLSVGDPVFRCEVYDVEYDGKLSKHPAFSLNAVPATTFETENCSGMNTTSPSAPSTHATEKREKTEDSYVTYGWISGGLILVVIAGVLVIILIVKVFHNRRKRTDAPTIVVYEAVSQNIRPGGSSPLYDTVVDPRGQGDGILVAMQHNSAYVISPPGLKIKVKKNEAYSNVRPQQ